MVFPLRRYLALLITSPPLCKSTTLSRTIYIAGEVLRMLSFILATQLILLKCINSSELKIKGREEVNSERLD